MLITDLLVPALIVSGLFFMLTGTLGLLRMPDFYTRANATGKCDTLGEGLMLLGFVLYEGYSLIAVKIVLLILFILISTPTAMHAVTNAAYNQGIIPWKRGDERR
jgi:multicomponent Na+:H+ antiporter subunit G